MNTLDDSGHRFRLWSNSGSYPETDQECHENGGHCWVFGDSLGSPMRSCKHCGRRQVGRRLTEPYTWWDAEDKVVILPYQMEYGRVTLDVA